MFSQSLYTNGLSSAQLAIGNCRYEAAAPITARELWSLRLEFCLSIHVSGNYFCLLCVPDIVGLYCLGLYMVIWKSWILPSNLKSELSNVQYYKTYWTKKFVSLRPIYNCFTKHDSILDVANMQGLYSIAFKT